MLLTPNNEAVDTNVAANAVTRSLGGAQAMIGCCNTPRSDGALTDATVSIDLPGICTAFQGVPAWLRAWRAVLCLFVSRELPGCPHHTGCFQRKLKGAWV